MAFFGVGVAVRQQQVEHHLADLLSNEGERPLEDVHEVGKRVGMLDLGILLKD